jgi:hypothetical protein
VAEPASSLSERNAGLDHHRGCRVPEVVHADARLTGIRTGTLQRSRPVGLGWPAAYPRAEQQVAVGQAVAVDPRPQEFYQPWRELLEVDVAPGELSATFTTVEFADHALTTELIEGELIAAIGQSRDELPLRHAYLPTVAATFELGRRACVGGVVSLLAIARRRGDVRDYVLFTQERSSTVLNLAGKLATIPKGFHQPTGEPTHEVRPSATVRREFEEELLGRQELEQIEAMTHSHVDLLHDQHLTEPMVWLLARPDSFRVECTGFGFNLVTGNYEFAGLVVVDDEDWWERFGHLVESNWEAERVNRHSTLDTAGLEALVADPRWGNESLFCLLQGLRRLREVGQPSRVAVPTIELGT